MVHIQHPFDGQDILPCHGEACELIVFERRTCSISRICTRFIIWFSLWVKWGVGVALVSWVMNMMQEAIIAMFHMRMLDGCNIVTPLTFDPWTT